MSLRPHLGSMRPASPAEKRFPQGSTAYRLDLLQGNSVDGKAVVKRQLRGEPRRIDRRRSLPNGNASAGPGAICLPRFEAGHGRERPRWEAAVQRRRSGPDHARLDPIRRVRCPRRAPWADRDLQHRRGRPGVGGQTPGCAGATGQARRRSPGPLSIRKRPHRAHPVVARCRASIGLADGMAEGTCPSRL